VAINEGGLAVMMRGGWAILHYALAVIFVLGAIWSFVCPVNSVFALASVLGLLLLLQGIFTLTCGLAMREELPYWWLDEAAGGLLKGLAIWISTSDRMWDAGERNRRRARLTNLAREVADTGRFAPGARPWSP